MAESDEDKILISRIIDTASAARDKNIIKSTCFLNGREISLAKRVMEHSGVLYNLYGGYNEAERHILLCYPDFLYPDVNDIPISVVRARLKCRVSLSHRDYMGAVLNLGIRREKIGDIVVCDDCGYIFCTSDIADYIVSQITKIGNCGVLLEVCEFNNVTIPPKKFKEITDSVSSVRLDAVVSASTGLSRGESARLIESGLVSVNWEVKTKTDFNPKEGDIFSVKGYGRILFYKLGGTSKKGRIFITLRRYI